MSRESKELKAREQVTPKDFSRGHQYDHDVIWGPKSPQKPLTFFQRLRILIGYNVYIRVRINTEHKPGECAIGVFAETTKYDAEELKQMPKL